MKKFLFILTVLFGILVLSFSMSLAISHIIKTLLEEKTFSCPIDSEFCDLEIWKNSSKVNNVTVESGGQLEAKFYKYVTTTTSTTTTSTTTTTLPPTTTTTSTTTTIPSKGNNFYTFKANFQRTGIVLDNGNGNNLLWRINITGTDDEFATPIIVNDVVYWNSRQLQKTFALDAYTGKIFWEFNTGGSDDSATYDLETGILYVSGYKSRYLWALNSSKEKLPDDKRVIWKFQVKGDRAVQSPAIGDGLVFMFDRFVGHTVYAIDKLTGIERWHYDLPGKSFVVHNPTYWNGRLYVCGNDIGDPEFYVFNASTGQILWTSNIIQGWGCFDSGPVIDNGLVYIGDKSSRLHVLNATTGQVKWSKRYGSNYISATPTIHDGKVFFGGRDGILWAVDKNNGNILWTFKSQQGTWLYSSVTATPDGTIYFFLDGRLYAADEDTGQIKWNYYMGPHGGSSPAVYNGIVYIGTDTWWLYAIGTPIN